MTAASPTTTDSPASSEEAIGTVRRRLGVGAATGPAATAIALAAGFLRQRFDPCRELACLWPIPILYGGALALVVWLLAGAAWWFVRTRREDDGRGVAGPVRTAVNVLLGLTVVWGLVLVGLALTFAW